MIGKNFGAGLGARQADQSGNYNTPLSAQEEAAFQQWSRRLPPNLQSVGDYDLRGAFKGNARGAENGHLPDTWKKPNHPTFSNESIYSGPSSQGGQWIEKPGGGWLFMASPDNLRYRTQPALENYFRRVEPDSRMIPPVNAINLFKR